MFILAVAEEVQKVRPMMKGTLVKKKKNSCKMLQKKKTKKLEENQQLGQ